MSADQELWVFGYGSLMWRPGFAYEVLSPAQIVGFTRSFCIYSTHHRGSQDRPGLVLGLDRGGACHGLAYRVAPKDRRDVMAYLRAREQINGVYRESWAPIWLESRHRQVLALTYIVERAHPSYAGRLPFAEQVRLIRAARGLSGSNVEYLANTVLHLAELGLRDRQLERLATQIGGLFAVGSKDGQGRSRADALVATCRVHPPTAPLLRRHERRRFMHRLQLDRLRE